MGQFVPFRGVLRFLWGFSTPSCRGNVACTRRPCLSWIVESVDVLTGASPRASILILSLHFCVKIPLCGRLTDEEPTQLCRVICSHVSRPEASIVFLHEFGMWGCV